MAPRTSRILLVLVPLLALVTGLAPVVEPAARGVDATPAAESPSPDVTPTPADPDAPRPATTPTPTPTPGIGSPGSPMSDHLSGDVYGYLPYWEMTSAIAGLPRLRRPLRILASSR